MPYAAPDRPRIIIVDDHDLFAEGVRRILDPSFNIVEVVPRPSGVLSALQTHRPDIVLLDISMPGTNGIETARQILERYPDIKVIFLTMHTESIYVRQAMSTGAQGYVLKGSLVSELVEAIRAVLAGRIYTSPSVERPRSPEAEQETAGSTAVLSPKQVDVLKLLSHGRSAKEIAEFLNISVKTVEFHKTRIRQRLGLHSTAELTRFALENHL
jgi:DNA-binding NarL/FixJ family response regulator